MRVSLLLVLFFASKLIYAQNNKDSSDFSFGSVKLSGYIQTQFQKAESSGINSFSGGDFSENTDNRFLIRRGRIKIEKVDKYSNFVFQLDATQSRVQLMDAYIQLKAPKFAQFSLTAGLFNRPFGYVLSYSSSSRDFPERPRVFQLLLPRERDIGVMATYQPLQRLKFLTLQLAVVNGSGLTSKDYDSRKDIIGNIEFKFDSLLNDKVELNFGASIYEGSVQNTTNTYYNSINGGFNENLNANLIGKYLARNYYGANLQLQYDNCFGKTTFKTEYIAGQQPGLASSNDVDGPYASQSFSAQPLTNLFARNFSGYYLWLTQQIGTTKLQALVGYDVYDPNTNVKGLEIGRSNSFTTAGDVKYTTLGYGFTFKISNRITFTIYNEHVKNENTSLVEVPNDIKDDVFTTRLQYRW